MRGTKPTEALGRPDEWLVDRFEVRVVSGPDKGLRHQATERSFAIGTHERNGLVLRDPTMSRFHCEIRIVEGKALVRDLGSRNGTLVDGVAIQSAFLRDGQTLELGRTKVRFTLGKEKIGIPLSQKQRFGLLVGASAPMRALFAQLEQAARSDVTILLQGETGTGKDLAAESVHSASGRRDGPFVVVDCGAVVPALFESELFGHVRGAFTGAQSDRAGAFEATQGGTLFLDEIGELPLDLQPKLLRAIERRTVQRVGSTKPISVDVRVIAATNRNLRRDVNENRFRSDLYYRLAVFQVALPPLRERLEDLSFLVDDLLTALAPEDSAIAAEIRTDAVLEKLRCHVWPGNVRELRNHLERCIAASGSLSPSASPAPEGELRIDSRDPFHLAKGKWLSIFEQRYLEDLVRRNGDNLRKAAHEAGLSRGHLYKLLSQRGLRRRE